MIAFPAGYKSQGKKYNKRVLIIVIKMKKQKPNCERTVSRSGPYPLTFLKIASCRSFSLPELTSRLVLREGTHL